jgi:Pretoxin HINT domain
VPARQFLRASAACHRYDRARLFRISQNGMATKPAACSFEGETRVLMADGTTNPIDEVRVGDEVLAQDRETGEKSARKVTHLWVHDDEYVRLEIGSGTVLTTANHPFWNDTDKRWERADELNVGDDVLTADGRRVRVGYLQSAAGHGAAYNLTVEGLHTYHVLVGHAAVLVHNTCPLVELAEQSPVGQTARVVNSKMPHAVGQGVERGVFSDAASVQSALQDLGRSIETNGFPRGTIPDSAGGVIRPDSVLVPVGNGGYAVYRVVGGKATLQTVLNAR